MIPLGSTVMFRGRPALVVARTLAGTPSYDLRFEDGTVAKYVAEADLDAPDASHLPDIQQLKSPMA
ncbi:hypothetical protein [Azospirillum thermophilum]|uniref:DUF1918 domain-containing protein n=1 Tax=Azospirillum thermophilum TaxID=2202148 RepID=A0A2S2CSG8_9PROT|nr:hypothetical protein [Azospirillum thermophilum]AWK87237.1 hypothetical protein DEW08_14325 [Azospirillum thermophilum]